MMCFFYTVIIFVKLYAVKVPENIECTFSLYINNTFYYKDMVIYFYICIGRSVSRFAAAEAVL